MSGSALVTTGKSLMLVIVTMKVSLTVSTPEDAVTVIEAVPYCSSLEVECERAAREAGGNQ